MTENLQRTEAILLLETGAYFTGNIFGHFAETFGEVVFNTAVVGYEEVLTDPSYKGQIVVMTYPHIGNYGITYSDFESFHPWVEGFVVNELSSICSNWRAKEHLEKLFKKYKIVGIQNVDTRALTKYIRDNGALRGVITPLDEKGLTPTFLKKLLTRVREYPKIEQQDLVKLVRCKKEIQTLELDKILNKKVETGMYKVVVLDCGCKFNILRLLRSYGCELIVVPANTQLEKILSYRPDGIFLSNGPGDPESVPYVFTTIEKLIQYEQSSKDYIPIFGICLGHQMIALALGGKTFKLKFGHHGINHPVKNLVTQKIEITSQNHNFAVKIYQKQNKWFVEGNNELEVTHLNLNDYSCEGIRHKSLPIFSVQYHPEASPGPNDSKFLFQQFIDMIKEYKTGKLI